MARQRDQFLKPRWEAERLVQELGIEQLPVDPYAVAEALGILLKPMPESAGGASGMLLHVDGVFGIGYPTHIDNEGYKRFSVAHEIGHYRLPGHVDAVMDASGKHLSKANFQSSDLYEQEADHFASALLMPTRLFSAAVRRAGEGLKAIEALHEQCETSLEATAIRYALASRDPVAVIRSEGSFIDYAFMSDPLKDFPDLDWIRKGTPLPAASVTADFNGDADNVTRACRAEGESLLQDWFNGPHRQDVVEEVVGLGRYGKTMTVLTGMDPPDEADDDDVDESRAVRF